MKRIITLVLVTTSLLVQSQSLSFEEAVMILETGNKKLQGTKKKQQSKEYAVKAMKGHRFPEIKLTGSYVYMSDHMYADFNDKKPAVQNIIKTYKPVIDGFNPLLAKYASLPQVKQLMALSKQTQAQLQGLMTKDWKYKFQDQQFAKVSLDLKYPIFTGGKINTGIKVKKLQSEIAKVEVEKTKGILVAKLAERYFQTKLAEEAIKVRSQNLESAQKHLFNAQKMQENGMIAPVQAMLAKTAVADAERAVLATKKDAELAKTALEGLLGGKQNITNLTTELFKLKKLEKLEYYQSLAKEKYPDIVKAEIQRELANQNIRYQKAGHLPDVAIIGKKNLYTKNLPIIEPQDWFVGIGFEMHLSKGFQHRRKIQEAKTMKEGVDMLIEQAKVDVQTLVKKYYTEILKQQEQLESLEKSVNFSEELVRVRNKAFKEGFATSTEVADANLYNASIKIKRLKAMFEIDKNLAKLLEVCGQGNTFFEYK